MHECDKEKEGKKEDGLSSLLLKSRTVILAGQIDQEMAEKVIAQLMILDADSHDPIKLVITSQGGHVDSGYAIHDIVKFIQSPVVAIGAGWVASIAVPILMGAMKKNRVSLPNTRFLLHQPSGGAGGQLSDIRIQAQEILKIRERLNRLLAAETGQPIDKIKDDSDRDFWMSAQEALDYGIISRIVSSVRDLD